MDPSQENIFSTAPVSFEGKAQGYLYVVLASQEAQSLAQQLSDSHIARLTVAGMIGLFIFFSLSSLYRVFCKMLLAPLNIGEPLGFRIKGILACD